MFLLNICFYLNHASYGICTDLNLLPFLATKRFSHAIIAKFINSPLIIDEKLPSNM